MENISNLRGLRRQCVHAQCLTPCVCLVCVCVTMCLLMFVRKCLLGRWSICNGPKKRSKSTELEEEQKNRETLARIEGCNLIY